MAAAIRAERVVLLCALVMTSGYVGAAGPAITSQVRSWGPRSSYADVMETFGSQLRSWRTARRISQEALADRAGVSARHLSFVENGRAKPSREVVLALAGALDVPLRE